MKQASTGRPVTQNNDMTGTASRSCGWPGAYELCQLKVANLHQPKDSWLSTRLSQIVAHVSAFDTNELLSDVGGHEVLTALRRYLKRIGAGNIRADDLEQELVTAVEAEYQTFR